ncbi:energy-coupling factor transport system ATP-binding protein [Methanococcoides vulcani]|uniref:Energy-coupling factor transport system ATP-binding protein n=1 Tax=Methanococcoides vulcani TaxID=1353158 RepID=A0A1H9Z394_9EURY|nr:ATP-binding cassette domain-containing protein [Methanococcoides vulcani]SES76014.1 energy-coupling factor transport system ATP-binding protein [Methanococcoides vulcani]
MIRFEGVSYSYPDDRQVLNGIDLQIEKGTFTTIIGDNGSGKSTLVRHMNGLLTPSDGTVSVCGMGTFDPENLWEIRQMVGMVFQDPHSQAVGATVEEDVAFGPENLALKREEVRIRVSDSILDVGLEGFEEHLLMNLSGGQLQKTALAGVLAMKAEYLVFDEVTSMLDQDSRSQVLEIVLKLNRMGKTIVYVTHHMEEVLASDRVIVMEGGSVAIDGSPADVFRELYNSGHRIPPLMELVFRLQDSGILDRGVLPVNANSLMEGLCQSM